jgi:hypothetical protein
MKNKLILAAVLAAVTGGVAATSAQAVPFKAPLTEKAASNVEAVHYNTRQRPWWWKSNRYEDHHKWRKHLWWKQKQKHNRDWSWRDDRRGHDHDRRW